MQLSTVLTIDSITAKQYGTIVAALYAKGKPIPTNDIWIAATALQHSLTLISADKHFNEISQLKTKSW